MNSGWWYGLLFVSLLGGICIQKWQDILSSCNSEFLTLHNLPCNIWQSMSFGQLYSLHYYSKHTFSQWEEDKEVSLCARSGRCSSFRLLFLLIIFVNCCRVFHIKPEWHAQRELNQDKSCTEDAWLEARGKQGEVTIKYVNKSFPAEES